ncbi:single-stranded-DNA-specific exonuclease RecJ [Marinoscillum furvescens]|uniref:Single-stranded-DNA-specific exonuclease RecJ n=1 Tax=Marinoscillum furvescens DSM 4134 TaxID=1122208 RepID=A0A3D9L5N0_MARFU|nr:single-stranded-DNA-specific exonuclease RecJ [Marinoscillum furvescens]REE00414.1 exonuclease RecJ [Marinoscillum furvescens DSM 4134]
MEKRWVLRDIPNKEKLDELSRSLNINKQLATLLLQRGVSTFDEAKTFFRPSLDHLHDPFLMLDMDRAVNRLCEAIFSNEKILIYGDYDVDGTTSVSLMYGFLKAFSDQLVYYIPDRYTEGYGISTKGIEHAHAQGIQLIISLDCGIRAVDKAALAKSYGIDLIICDHHLPGEELPDAYAILDPKRPGDNYPFKELSGCGVGFKLLQGFCEQNSIDQEQLFVHLDLVCVSIASDIVPIVGENRVLAYYGLKKLNHSPCPGLKALIDVSSLRGELDITSIVFYLGPRINATGRLTHAHDSVKLLTAEDASETEVFAQVLHAKNAQRKDFDKTITEEALEMVSTNTEMKDARSTVLFKNDWHKGVIGIVASRCIEKYYRPTIILTESEQKATGSARSVEGFDIHAAISQCEDLLLQFGGHTHAAGLTLPLENVPAFQQKFEEVVATTISPELLVPRLEVDLEVALSFANYKNYMILKQMAPFGPQNLTPVLVARKVKLKSPPRVIKETHLKMDLCEDGNDFTYPAIGFGLAEKLPVIQSSEYFDVAFQLEENEYRGHKSLQLNIKDVKIA